MGTPFSGYPGTPKHCPFLNYPIRTLSLKKSKSVSLDLADFFLGTLKDPKGSHKKKKLRNASFRVPRYPQTLPVFLTIRYVTLSFKKSKSVSLDLADFCFRDS